MNGVAFLAPYLQRACIGAVCLAVMPVIAQAQDNTIPQDAAALQAEIEAALSAYERHVEGLENAPQPEGSTAAVQAAIDRLKGATDSEFKLQIEAIVKDAAREWIGENTPQPDPFAPESPDPDLANTQPADPEAPPKPSDEPQDTENTELAGTDEGQGETSENDGTEDQATPADPASPNVVASFNDLTLPSASANPGRVLTLPGALVRSRDGQSEQPPFTVLYNHGSADVSGTPYLAVGARREVVDGWIELDKTEEWRSMLVMEYADLANRERVVFFNEPDDVRDVLRSHFSGPDDARALYRSISERQFDNSKIVAIEPATSVEGDERPYLMPILSFEKERFDDIAETPVFLLELAAVNLESQSRREEDAFDAPKKSIDKEEAAKNLKVGLVFVVDATQSMGPYIEEVQRFLLRTRDRAAQIAPGQIDFGLLGYRDNTTVNSQIEYVTEYFLPLGLGNNFDFNDAVGKIQASKVSTRNWREDAFAGLADVIEGTNWSNYNARYVVLITDAGPRAFGDGLARNQALGARSIGRMAQRRKIALTMMHMLTDAGSKDHASAKAQYSEVAAALGAGAPTYWTLKGDTPQQFAASMDSVADRVLTRVANLFQGELVPKRTTFSDDPITSDLLGAPLTITSVEDAKRVADAFDDQLFAFQQEYLGKLEEGEAPDFYRAWVADRDLVTPQTSSMRVKVLMTRDQMSDLSARLGSIVQALDNKETGTRDAFRDMANLSGITTYDPTLPVSQMLPEYLAELPYGSRFMTMTPEVWATLGGQQQDEILLEVRDRIQLLESINTSQAGWLNLPGRGSNDALYPLALNDLP